MTQPAIALLGVGLMGAPMASNLIRAGYEVTLWNRTAAKCDPFRDRAAIADTPAEAASRSDLVITMLEHGEAVSSVLEEQGVLAAMSSGATVVDMSSAPPSLAKRLAVRCRNLGLGWLDAPVSGGTAGAEAAQLSIMAGGDADTLEQAQPVLDTLGRVTHIGPAGAGQLAKLANQAVVGITIGAVSEALMLAAEGGADPQAVRDALMGGFAGSRILELHGQRMIDRTFEPGAPSRIQLKDLRMILNQAHEDGLSLPLAQQTHDAYRALVANGHGETDHSGLLLGLEHLNGTRLRRHRPGEDD
ncbi:2-hydroxy-3-oxopropionate reductase [Tamilnaduibacter salinus]|uniref:2-hydroxy-3-oxopropionate reductase n=1 Tax=Tamilnaduibacter salinus TaxID=1484056 RepID=A0A2U1CZ01_9GAMM|nr:NAD(P)-dependent oxidoreductase [Tamilnaduibacter salinus]PVY77647.1 2-hydroxy-3-oxopropionate reductase [Tamilnaduibacter salinus]